MRYIKEAKNIFLVFWSVSSVLNILIWWNEGTQSDTAIKVAGIAIILYIVCIGIEKLTQILKKWMDYFYYDKRGAG